MAIFSRFFGRKNNLTVSSDIKKKDARSRNIAFVDTEVGLKDHKIHDIGALRYDGANFHQASQTALNKFLQEGKVNYICGHNLIHHDARYLQLNGILIDTLYLSPLLFPQAPLPSSGKGRQTDERADEQSCQRLRESQGAFDG